MSRKPMPDGEFSRLIADLRSETDDTEQKLAKLYYSRGNFSGPQVASLVRIFKTTPEKMRALRILEHRLCPMNCKEGENILRNVQLTQQDKLGSLDYIRRAFYDHQTMKGSEHIMRAFIHEKDKKRALAQLCAISSHIDEDIPAGIRSSDFHQKCHQSMQIGALKHVYGSIGLQNCPTYACQPSYAYGSQLDPSYYVHGGRPPLPPRPIDTAVTGPAQKLGFLAHASKPLDLEAHKPCYICENPCLSSEQSGVTSIGFIDHQKVTYSNCC
ncbi:hypothetical protein Aperf_G00000018219 [Anoplocephala perfoliata]